MTNNEKVKRRFNLLFLRPVAIVSILFLFSFIGEAQRLHGQTEYVTVFGDQQMDTNTAFMQGFVLGGTEFNVPLTQALKPSFWELAWDVDSFYDFVHPNFNAEIMVSIFTIYMRHFTDGNPLTCQPWTDNWVQWDALVDTVIHTSVLNRPVDYWVIWGEPDNDFSGTPAQYIEMHRRTDSILKATDPNAKLTGPDFIAFHINQILWVIDTLHEVGVHLDAISWHEYGTNSPEDVYNHVQQMRDSLTVRPEAGNPKIFIPEFAIPDHRLIPGWNVGWTYYFEKSKVDWVSHSCFDEFDGTVYWDDCFDGGLNGMYMQDGVTPQPLYWFYRAYAELNKPGRLVTSPAQPRTIALASKNDGNQEMKIIVGRYDSPLMGTQNASANVQLHIKNYPYGNNSTQTMVIQKVPAQTVPYSIPLNNPITVFSGTVSFTADSVTIPLNSFADGDAYIIYINPGVGSILSIGNEPGNEPEEAFSVQLYPNPTADYLTMVTNQQNITGMYIFDIAGRLLYQNSGSINSFSEIGVSEFANGIYILRITNNHGITKEKKFVVKH